MRLADDALAEIARSRDVVDSLAKDDRPHYGISTGFGALATTHIPAERRTQLQRSLIRSHAAGTGPDHPGRSRHADEDAPHWPEHPGHQH